MNVVRVTMKNRELAERACSFIYDKNIKVNDNYLSNQNNHFYVAMEEDEVVGAIFGHEFDRLDISKKQIFIYSLDVKEAYRRKGYATSLVNHLLDIAQKSEYHNVFLLADNNNTPAIKLYDSIEGENINKKIVEQVLYGWYMNIK